MSEACGTAIRKVSSRSAAVRVWVGLVLICFVGFSCCYLFLVSVCSTTANIKHTEAASITAASV